MKYIIVILVCFSSAHLKASQVDRTLKSIEHLSDSAQVDSLVKIARSFVIQEDGKSALPFAKLAYKKALAKNYRDLIPLVNLSLKKQLKKLPKKNIASKSLKNFGLAIYAKNRKNIIEAINTIAPEHLELLTNMNKEIIKGVKNAGSIFIGKFSPEAIGDYIAGPNHVLPTSGSARFSSGLSVNDFLKRHSLIKITKTGIERLGSSVINLAKHENLDGHANSVRLRLKKGN